MVATIGGTDLPVVSSLSAKNFLLFRLVETAIEPIHPALIRRGVARRHERGVRDAMDALGAQDGRLFEADGEVVWS